MANKLKLPLLTVFLCLVFVGTASAHVLQTDGNIGAILHINPDDSPTSNVSVNYVLYFEDTTNQFKLTKCNCSVSLQENGQTIQTQPLNVSSALNSSNQIVFPKPDVYHLVISGAPKPNQSFQPFKLDYLIRVTGATKLQAIPTTLWIGLSATIGLIILAAAATEIL